MNKKNKKETGVAGAVILLILFSLLSVVYVISEMDFMFASEPKDVKELFKGEKVEAGDYASVTIDGEDVLIIDWFAETKHYINGIIPVGKDRHCILYLDNGIEKSAFVSLTIKGKKNIEKIDDIIDYMYGVTEDDKVLDGATFKGQITSMDSEINNYYKTKCQSFLDELKDEYGYDFSNDIIIYNMTLDSTKTKVGSFLILGFCLAMVVVSVLLLISAKKKKKQDGATALLSSVAGSIDEQPVNEYGNEDSSGVYFETDKNEEASQGTFGEAAPESSNPDDNI